jgi:branched-chain amino acid aminotransferase
MSPEKEWIAYVNGEYVPQSQAKVSVFDHGFLYGDGVFDTWCTWNGYIFHLDRHIDRLYRSIHAFQIDMPLSKEEFRKIVIKVVETKGAKNQYIKAVVSRGVGPRPLLSPIGCKTAVVVFSRPYLRLVEPGQEDKMIRARITSIRRTPSQCVDPKAKNLNYANFVLAKLEVISSGADEAIMLDIDGFVNEAPGYNIFLVRDGMLFTPLAENILLGVTRDTAFEIAAKEGIPTNAARLIPYDLYTADEVFFCSTAGGIVGVGDIDGRRIGDGKLGPVTRKVNQHYLEMLEKGVHGTKFNTKE